MYSWMFMEGGLKSILRLRQFFLVSLNRSLLLIFASSAALSSSLSTWLSYYFLSCWLNYFTILKTIILYTVIIFACILSLSFSGGPASFDASFLGTPSSLTCWRVGATFLFGLGLARIDLGLNCSWLLPRSWNWVGLWKSFCLGLLCRPIVGIRFIFSLLGVFWELNWGIWQLAPC